MRLSISNATNPKNLKVVGILIFPDPYPRHFNRTKWLSSPKFLKIYQSVIKSKGVIHLKTDSDELFSFTKDSIQKSGCGVKEVVEKIYQERRNNELLTIQTYFEKRHLEKGRTISYIKFTLPKAAINGELD